MHREGKKVSPETWNSMCKGAHTWKNMTCLEDEGQFLMDKMETS